jgi:DnaJ-class molecular chaperone
MRTAYTTLQVTENALPEVIEAAWKALCKKFHPDVNPNADPRIMQWINRAHQILSDEILRRQYDLGLAAERERRAPVNRVVHTESGVGGMYGGVQFVFYGRPEGDRP